MKTKRISNHMRRYLIYGLLFCHHSESDKQAILVVIFVNSGRKRLAIHLFLQSGSKPMGKTSASLAAIEKFSQCPSDCIGHYVDSIRKKFIMNTCFIKHIK